MPAIEAGAQLASKQRWGFRTRQVETVKTVGLTADVLAPNNPDRIFLQLINEDVNSVFVGRNGGVTTASGVPLLSQWDSAAWTPDRDGEATGYERWAIANAAPSNVRVIETIRLNNA